MWESALTQPGAFVSTIADVKRGIAAGSFRSETEISRGVVGRILDGLGWPVFDVHVVTPEFKIGSKKVDYALCHPPGNPSVLFEVKALGKADGKGERQLFEYCWGPRIVADSRRSRDFATARRSLVRGDDDGLEYCPPTLCRVACNIRLRTMTPLARGPRGQRPHAANAF